MEIKILKVELKKQRKSSELIEKVYFITFEADNGFDICDVYNKTELPKLHSQDLKVKFAVSNINLILFDNVLEAHLRFVPSKESGIGIAPQCMGLFGTHSTCPICIVKDNCKSQKEGK